MKRNNVSQDSKRAKAIGLSIKQKMLSLARDFKMLK